MKPNPEFVKFCSNMLKGRGTRNENDMLKDWVEIRNKAIIFEKIDFEKMIRFAEKYKDKNLSSFLLREMDAYFQHNCTPRNIGFDWIQHNIETLCGRKQIKTKGKIRVEILSAFPEAIEIKSYMKILDSIKDFVFDGYRLQQNLLELSAQHNEFKQLVDLV